MKYISGIMIAAFCVSAAFAKPVKPAGLNFYKANDSHIKYIGRVDFKNRYKPKFWSPGVYVQAKFKGRYLKIYLKDEELYGNNHNYLEIAVDYNKPYRIKLSGKLNKIIVAGNLSNGVHTVTICKDTESGIGYIQFLGLKCAELLPVHEPKRKIEFIGDSITAGTGSDQSLIKCDQGLWYDQHNAYMSYGPTTARLLNAQWYLTAVAGIGMIHSCCNMNITMPQVFDKVNLRNDTLNWNFKKYTPDVLTICLGQNDGKADSVAFCSAYVAFIGRLRTHYPEADIVCLNSPMANAELTAELKRYILGIERYMRDSGDKKISHYFFSRSYNDGCGGHPSVEQHQLIAAQLAGYIKGLKGW